MEGAAGNESSDGQQEQQQQPPPPPQDEEGPSPELQLLTAVQALDDSMVRDVIQKHRTVNVNVKDERNPKQAPLHTLHTLHTAALFGHVKIVLRLLGRPGVNLDIRDIHGLTPLYLAAKNRHCLVAMALLDKGACLEAADYSFGRTPLLLACKNHDYDMALILITQGASLHTVDTDGRSVLHHACMGGALDDSDKLVELLLEKGAAVDTKCTHGATPLSVAASFGRTESMEMLLQNGADVHAKDNRGYSPLRHAASAKRENQLEAVRLLLNSGAAVDAKSSNGSTALHDANSPLIADELIQRGASIYARRDDGRAPFDTALDSCRQAVARFILHHYREKVVETHGRLSLHAIFKEATYSILQEDHDDDQHGEDEEESKTNSEAEREAAAAKFVNLPVGQLTVPEMLELVLQVLVSQDPGMIAAQDAHRSIPLHILSQGAGEAHIELLRWLVQQDQTMLHYSDSSGRLPLHVASYVRAPLETIRYLVEQGGVGTLAARDQEGALPLHSMVTRVPKSTNTGHGLGDDEASPPPKLDVVEYLISQYPGSVQSRNNNGELPIMLGCQSSAPEDVLLILLKARPRAVAYMKEHYNTKT